MKILMVNKFLYPRGGAETYFLKIGKYFEENGHNVEYFGMKDEKNIVGNCCSKYTMQMDFHNSGLKKFVYPFKIIYSFEAKRKIKQIIKEMKPDIIHLNNINFQLTPSIIDMAKKLHIPIVQTVHDYQMLCPNHLLFDIHLQKPCEKCISKSKWNCMKNNCIHNSRIKSMLGSLEGILYQIKNTYSKVEKYICPSYFLENKLLTNSMYKGKTKTIHNFIELSPNMNQQSKEDYVVYFGRLSEEKGIEIFLESCKMLPHIHFKIAGTGPMEDMCYGIDNVEYVGFKTGKELKDLIAKALFSVYPSIWYENCPLSILESESLGTPVLASNLGGIPELIEDGQTGIIVEKLSVEVLSSEIERLYKNKKLLANMQKQCLEKRENMISLEKYCEKLMIIYNEILENSNK